MSKTSTIPVYALFLLAIALIPEVAGRISEDAMLKWGARIDPSLQKNVLRIMVVLGGVEFAEYTETGIKKKILDNAPDTDLDSIFSEEDAESEK